MSKRRESADSNRRNFLKGAGLVGAAAAVASPVAANAMPAAALEKAKAGLPGPRQVAAENLPPSGDPVNQDVERRRLHDRCHQFSRRRVHVHQLRFELSRPARSHHQSRQQQARNHNLCARGYRGSIWRKGYAKMAGKPAAMACHGVVGLQHASMATYNSWADRVPVLIFGGNIMEADKRAPGAEWMHSGVDIGSWFVSLPSGTISRRTFSTSPNHTARAYKIATTPPMGPVFIALDAELQENPIPEGVNLRIPKYTPVIPPQADSAAIAQAAQMLVNAQNPLLICDRMARTPGRHGQSRVRWPETLQCGVIDNAGRMNFPSRHPLNQSFRRGLIGQADVILAMEMNDLWGTLTHFSDRIERRSKPAYKKDTKIITLGTRDCSRNPTTRISAAGRTSISISQAMPNLRCRSLLKP